MKLNEILSGQERNRALLKHWIIQGEKPEITNAYFIRGGFGWGDLEALGWAVRHSEPVGRDDVKEWWEYTGPNSIVVGGREMKKGDVTPPVTVDYS